MTSKSLLWGTGAVALAGIGGWAWTHKTSASDVIYKTAPVEKSDLRQVVSATGVVQPFTVVDIKSRAGGEVKTLAVDVGTRVKAGQLIARIDPTDSQTTFDQALADVDAGNARISQAEQNQSLQGATTVTGIAQAQAAVVAAQARLTQAKAQAAAQPALTQAAIRQARASLFTSRQTLAQIQQGTDPQARADAQSAYASAQANLTNAGLQLKRQQQLVDKGFVAQSSVDIAQATYDVAKAQTEAAQTRAQTVGQSQTASIEAAKSRVNESQEAVRTAEANRVQIDLRKQDVANAAATLAQAQANLQTALANRAQISIRGADVRTARAQIARSQASLTNAKIVLGSTTIRAPRNGVILQKYVEQGTIITSGQSFNSQGTSIVQLGDVSRVLVDAAVDEADISQVSLGQKVKITLDALPDKEFEGRVRLIDPRGSTDQNVTTIRTRIEILNPEANVLRPGLNAECEFLVREKKDVLVIPTKAVRGDKGKKTVQVLPQTGDKGKGGPQPEPQTRTITTGMETGDSVEVVDGLKEGDTVVTATIKPGDMKGGKGGGPGDKGGFGGGGGKGGGR